MASSSQPPTERDKINFDLDIQLMLCLLHTIHSTDLIHRQPTAAQRSLYASTVSSLEHRIAKIEEQLKKRKNVGRRLEKWLTCRDREYERFVALQGELNRVFSVLMIGATSTPPLQKPSPESGSGDSSKSGSGSSSDRGLWMAGGEGPSSRQRDIDELISNEEFGQVPTITLTMPGSSQASERSGSGETIKASRGNPLENVDGEKRNVDEQAGRSEISSSSENGGLWIKKTNSVKGVERERGLWEMVDTD